MINCLHSLHNHAPFNEGSPEGVKTSMAKRAIIGIVLSALLAVGTYYLNMAWNLYGLSPEVHFALSVTGSTLTGVVLLAITGVFVYSTHRLDQEVKKNGEEGSQVKTV